MTLNNKLKLGVLVAVIVGLSGCGGQPGYCEGITKVDTVKTNAELGRKVLEILYDQCPMGLMNEGGPECSDRVTTECGWE